MKQNDAGVLYVQSLDQSVNKESPWAFEILEDSYKNQSEMRGLSLVQSATSRQALNQSKTEG